MALAVCVRAVGQDGDCPTLYVRGEVSDEPVDVAAVAEIVFPMDGGVRIVLADGAELFFTDEEFVSLRFDSVRPVKPTDGPEEPVIPGDDGVDDVANPPELAFDGNAVVSMCGGIAVYTPDGEPIAVARGGVIDVYGLRPGIYVAVSGGRSLKFVK